MATNPFYPYGAPGLSPFQQFGQPGIGMPMPPFQPMPPGMFPYPTPSAGFSSFTQSNLGPALEPYVHPGSVRTGVPTEVVHIEGHPLSMYLQLCNENVISAVQNELRLMSEDPEFAKNYMLSEPLKVN